MIPVQVTAKFNPDGEVTPQAFHWQGMDYPVASTGRRWHDEKGLHVLVMSLGEQVFELVFVPAELVWYMGSLGAYRA